MRACLAVLASAMALTASGAALAQAGLDETGRAEQTGFSAIAAGHFAQAERRISAERRIFPDRPELMLNLAAVYSRTGREAQARTLYTSVLQRPDVLMDLPGGDTASSHALAQAGLRRSSGMAAR